MGSGYTVAGISGALAIGFGAFGAHALKNHVTDERLLAAFTTGAHYHLAHRCVHVLAIFTVRVCIDCSARLTRTGSVALLALGPEPPATPQTLFLIGITLFSGSLYMLPLNRCVLWLQSVRRCPTMRAHCALQQAGDYHAHWRSFFDGRLGVARICQKQCFGQSRLSLD